MELTIEVQPQETWAAEPFCGRGVGGQDSHSVWVGTVEVTVHLLLSVWPGHPVLPLRCWCLQDPPRHSIMMTGWQV